MGEYTNMGYVVKTWSTGAGLEACITRKKTGKGLLVWVAVPEVMHGAGADGLVKAGVLVDDVVEYGPPLPPSYPPNITGERRRRGVWARIDMGSVHGLYARTRAEEIARSLQHASSRVHPNIFIKDDGEFVEIAASSSHERSAANPS